VITSVLPRYTRPAFATWDSSWEVPKTVPLMIRRRLPDPEFCL
jgi:hypothetical protein